MTRSIEEIQKIYTRLDEEWLELDNIPLEKATINQINRCDWIGDKMSDLEVEAGGYQNLKRITPTS